MHDFLAALRSGSADGLTTARELLESHRLAFAAEESRLDHRVIDMALYRNQAQT